MATVTGGMTTTTVLSDQLAIDISNVIKQLEPDAAPLVVLSRAMEKRRTVAAKFKWLESESKARFDTTSEAVASTTTQTIPVTNPTYFQQWDLVLNTRTGELLRVDAVTSAAIVTTRAIGSTAANLNSGDELMIVGTAQPENDTSKPARAKIPTKSENYTQIFRTPWEASGTLRAGGFMVQPREWSRLGQQAAIEHAKDIELAMWFSRRSSTTPGPNEVRTTAGVLSFITTNQTDAGGALSEAEFNAAMLQGFRYGSKNKVLFASGVGVSALNKFPASKQITKNDESTYGMDVTRYTGPFGSVNLIWHRLFEGSKYGGYIVGLDMGQIAYRYLGGGEEDRDTHVRPNIQPPDQDGRKDELLSECGLELGLQRTHFCITGITS